MVSVAGVVSKSMSHLIVHCQVALRMLASCRYHVSRHFRPTALLEVPLRPLSADNVGRARRRHDGQLEG